MSDEAWVKGIRDLQDMLNKLGQASLKEGAAALYQEALIEQKESMRRTPVDTGALRASHMTERPVIVEREATVRIVVGGPAGEKFLSFAKKGGAVNNPQGYAFYVHENLDADHKVGQAKYLESTVKESAPFLPGRIAKRMQMRNIVNALRKKK